MFHRALVFLVAAILAALLTLTGMPFAAVVVAKVLLVIFLMLFFLSLVIHITQSRARSLN